MKLVNSSPLQAGVTVGLDADGRQRAVVVVKATYGIPPVDAPAELAATQLPLVMADTFTGTPGFSATHYEAEYAPFKPRCDVLLLGSAHAPGGRPVERLSVSLRVGELRKSFDVLGERRFKDGFLGPSPGPIEPFARMPISYDRAYGGADASPKKPEQTKTYLENPIGVGYYPLSKGKALVGKALANTAERGKTPTDLRGRYRPLAFGPLGRNFAPRLALTGTYDERWQKERCPLLPEDFDVAYHQSAPVDQQLPHLRGGELVELGHLAASGPVRFALPTASLHVEFHGADGTRNDEPARLDTVLFEPDEGRFSLVWRASRPLARDLFDLEKARVITSQELCAKGAA